MIIMTKIMTIIIIIMIIIMMVKWKVVFGNQLRTLVSAGNKEHYSHYQVKCN